MMAGLCAGFTLAIILFSKVFPVITLWEMEKEEADKSGKTGGKRET
jgi:hypothetical protein